MSEKDHIKIYSAADIENYWKGKLSQSAMHAMEKAAMDDPFLADAMEGYRNTSSAEKDMALLKDQLAARTGVKPFPRAGSKFSWLRVAAAVVIIGGSGVLASQLFFKNDQNKIAAKEKTSETADPAKKQIENNIPPADTMLSETNAVNNQSLNLYTKDSVSKNSSRDFTPPTPSKTDSPGDKIFEGKIAASREKTQPEEETEKPKEESFIKIEKVKDDQAFLKSDPVALKENDKANNYATEHKQKGLTSGIEANRAKKNAGVINLFRGRTVDAQNNPVPFANITNREDQVGTYSDAKGYFSLVSADTTLNVSVRSLGYEPQNLRLSSVNDQKNIATIVMQEDKDAMPDEEMVIARRTVKSPSRSLKLNEFRKAEAEEPEPEDGWENYDTYITNNFRIPQGSNINANGEVELSFSIDKQGRPTNIKVLRSLCRECNDEVIRLLKEGPRWKRRSGSSKTKVIIAVDQK